MGAEAVHVVIAVRRPDTIRVVGEALGDVEPFRAVEAGSAEEVASALADDPVDVLLVEPPLSPELRSPLGKGGRPPLVVIGQPGQDEVPDSPDGRPVEWISPADLSAPLLRRTVRHVVERARAEEQRLSTERALIESEQRYRSLFQQSRDAIFMTELNGDIVEANSAAVELLGYPADQLVGSSLGDLYADPADHERLLGEIEARGHARDFEVRLRRSDGTERWCLISAWGRHDGDEEILGYQGIIHDISERKEVERQLAHEAFHDGLTGLPNRALFMDRLERAVARRRRGEERQLAVLFLDLDRFKVINDSLGHFAGDELLRQVGRVLQEQVREEDTVARIGGDEFAVLLDGVDEAAAPTHVAERIQERLRSPFAIQGHNVFTSVSIGITFGGGDIQRAEDLLRDADTAMYRAKELGPARYQIFDEHMHAHALSLLQLETDLRLGLEREEFILHYQPLVDLADRSLIGFEALIRWQHPRRGLLQPQAFIPVAEDTGLIVPMGEWVVRTAARQLRLWQDRNDALSRLFVSINVAQRQLSHSGLADLLRDVLLETGLSGDAFRLELNESVLTRHRETTIATLRQLRRLGVGLCIDDFGTGYSSLHHLHDLPIDSLKIDRSFVRRLTADGEGQHLVGTIVALARQLGLRTIAEGVETDQQLEILRQLGSGSVQGFLLSVPLDVEAAGKLLDQASVGVAPPPAERPGSGG